jgi:type IX secretion system PorP/SprF family membrane protein
MKNRILMTIACVVAACSYAQAQGIGAELYPFNYTFINPSFAGLDGQKISMLANSVDYSGAFGNSRQTIGFIAYENYFAKINSGFSVVADAERFGPSSVSNYALSYAYKVKLKESVFILPAIRVRRNIYDIDYSFFELIQPSDPLIGDLNITEKNWTTSASLLFQVRKTNFGFAVDNVLHSDHHDATLESTSNRFDQLVSFIAGTEFKLSSDFSSRHSLYVPVDMINLRMDVNNTFIWKNLLIAGASLEYSGDQFYPKFFTGVTIANFATISTMLYSRHRDDFNPKFRGEIYVQFKLNKLQPKKD